MLTGSSVLRPTKNDTDRGFSRWISEISDLKSQRPSCPVSLLLRHVTGAAPAPSRSPSCSVGAQACNCSVTANDKCCSRCVCVCVDQGLCLRMRVFDLVFMMYDLRVLLKVLLCGSFGLQGQAVSVCVCVWVCDGVCCWRADLCVLNISQLVRVQHFSAASFPLRSQKQNLAFLILLFYYSLSPVDSLLQVQLFRFTVSLKSHHPVKDVCC